MKVTNSEYPSSQEKPSIGLSLKENLDLFHLIMSMFLLMMLRKINMQKILAFIYDAFPNVRADSMNFYLVEQNKKAKCLEGRFVSVPRIILG